MFEDFPHKTFTPIIYIIPLQPYKLTFMSTKKICRSLMTTIIVVTIAILGNIAVAARTLTLDECRRLALENNKQLSATRMKQEVADNAKAIAKAQYLPKVDAVGSYLHTSKDISLLNNDQKAMFSGMGTSVMTSAGQALPNMLTELASSGLITEAQGQALQQIVSKYGPSIAQTLNGVGDNIVDAFRTDTKNIWAGSIMLIQPIYAGGKIDALNKIADINRELVANEGDNAEQTVLINTEKAYWLAVSLKHKQGLAQQFYDLLKKLNGDVDAMVREGVATKADALSVSVKVNEAEMTLTQVENGLALSRMALCQICGLPISSEINLADESNESLDASTCDNASDVKKSLAFENRPEIKMLQNAADIAREGVTIARSEYLPTVALTAGYMISNPNVFNGFQKKFSGVWNVGVMFRMPIWNWFETKYKIRAAKATTRIAEMKVADAKELIELQVNQNEFKLNEAHKKVTMTQRNIKSADENLRAATIGFKEGVMTTSNVLEAQTAWLKAQTQKIDAEIDLKLAEAEMKKTLGIIKY